VDSVFDKAGMGLAISVCEQKQGLRTMSVFVVKMLTILGFVLFAGGPVDALKLAVATDDNLAEPSVICASCEKIAVLDISDANPLTSLRPAVGGAFWDADLLEYNENMDAEISWENRDGFSGSQGTK